MPGAGRSESVAALWRRLNAEQRVAAVAAVLLIVSTFGPFSFVEAAIALLALGVLALLRARALGRQFHLPFGDGAVIAAAGAWAGVLIAVRLFDRPLGQNMLAIACAALLAAAGIRERAKRPADDLPAGWARDEWVSPEPRERPPRRRPAADAPTEPLGRDAATQDLREQEPEEPPTRPLPREPE